MICENPATVHGLLILTLLLHSYHVIKKYHKPGISQLAWSCFKSYTYTISRTFSRVFSLKKGKISVILIVMLMIFFCLRMGLVLSYQSRIWKTRRWALEVGEGCIVPAQNGYTLWNMKYFHSKKLLTATTETRAIKNDRSFIAVERVADVQQQFT